MLKKKSAIFALIAVLMFALAMYFTYRETKETYDFGDFETEEEPEEDTETEEPEPEPVQTTIKSTVTDGKATETTE